MSTMGDAWKPGVQMSPGNERFYGRAWGTACGGACACKGGRLFGTPLKVKDTGGTI